MKFAYELTAEDKAEFVELLAQGWPANEAAEELDSTGTMFRKHYSGNSQQYFDPDFAQAVQEAKLSAKRALAQIEDIDSMIWKEARKGKQWAIEKLALTYHPDYAWAKSRNFHHSVEVELVKRFPTLSREAVQEIIDAEEKTVEARQLKALPSG